MDFFLSILKNLPDGAALGLVWGIMAIGVYITFKILDIPDMTVDGTFALGGCMIAATVSSGWNPFVSTALAVVCGMVAGLADYLWNYPRVMSIFWFVFALAIAGVKVCRREAEEA